MKKILVIHPQTSYLPEIEAYKEYFNNKSIFFFYDIKDLKNINYSEYDLLWFMMGTDFKKYNIPKIHDYASISTGAFKFAKNFLKRIFNQKPELRLFLNQSVENAFYFNDGVPHVYRDMGVSNLFFDQEKIDKKYDFVYIGAITKERKLNELFEVFSKSDRSLLVIGNLSKEFLQYKQYKNITFTGKVQYSEVPLLAKQAEYGINLIPNKYPYNIQTSTKLLEYIVLGLKVITTDYIWINEFEKKHNVTFLKIDENLNDFNFSIIDNFTHNFLSIREKESLRWEHVIKEAKIEECLDNILLKDKKSI